MDHTLIPQISIRLINDCFNVTVHSWIPKHRFQLSVKHCLGLVDVLNTALRAWTISPTLTPSRALAIGALIIVGGTLPQNST